MATLRKKRKSAAVSRETPENTKNSQSQSTLDPGMAQEIISQVSEETEGRVTKKLSKDISQTESRILGALSKLDEFLLNPQVRTCSVAVPGTSTNNDSANRKPTGDRSLSDRCPEAVFSSHHSGNLNGSELEETHHNFQPLTQTVLFNCITMFLHELSGQQLVFKCPWTKIRQSLFSSCVFLSFYINCRYFSYAATRLCSPVLDSREIFSAFA